MVDLFQPKPPPPTFREHIISTYALTALEAEAVELACDGLTPIQIAECLEITGDAAECRLRRVKRKCNLATHERLVSYFASVRRTQWRFTHEARVQDAHPDMDAWLERGAA